jgi:hypothetical protein
MPISTWITAMSKDSDLYGEDIRLWSEAQSALLRSLSAGEAVRVLSNFATHTRARDAGGAVCR